MTSINHDQHFPAQQPISHFIQVGSLRIHIKPSTKHSLVGSTQHGNVIKLSLRDFDGELEIEPMSLLENGRPPTAGHRACNEKPSSCSIG
jgi:hypothetical protein